MKSAYELAMERLQKQEPTRPLSETQKQEIAEIDSLFKARIAEKEVFLGGEISKAQAAGEFGELEKLQTQLSRELQRLKEDCEEKKEKVRKQNADS